MLTLHRARGTWQRDVDAFVALTGFVKQKLSAAGLPAERIHVKPNFLLADPGVGGRRDGSVLFVGRLAEEKGIQVLLDAWRECSVQAPLRIVGDGPLAHKVKEAAETNEHVQWLGWQPPARVLDLLGESALLVVPSIWHEPFGRVVIEAFARATPVVASDAGGLTHIVNDGITGVLVPPGEPLALGKAVQELLATPEGCEAMGASARRSYEESYTASANYRRLMEIYAAALRTRDARA